MLSRHGTTPGWTYQTDGGQSAEKRWWTRVRCNAAESKSMSTCCTELVRRVAKDCEHTPGTIHTRVVVRTLRRWVWNQS